MFKRKDYVANVEIKAVSDNERLLPMIKVLEGIYPVKEENGRYEIAIDKNPIDELPIVKAEVDDSTSNIQYVLGIKRTFIKLHGLFYKEIKYSPSAHAHVTDSEGSNISKGTILYYPPITKDDYVKARKRAQKILKKWINFKNS